MDDAPPPGALPVPGRHVVGGGGQEGGDEGRGVDPQGQRAGAVGAKQEEGRARDGEEDAQAVDHAVGHSLGAGVDGVAGQGHG